MPRMRRSLLLPVVLLGIACMIWRMPHHAVAQTGIDVDVSGPRDGLAGVSLTWTASVKPTSVNDIVYTWDFGDGTTATGAQVTHTYAQPGAYHLSCTASSASDAAPPNTESHTITIAAADGSRPALATKINVDMDAPQRAEAGEAVPFSATADGANGAVPDDIVYTWDFGDGSPTVHGADVEHVYTAHGVYSVHVSAVSTGHQELADGDRQRITIT